MRIRNLLALLMLPLSALAGDPAPLTATGIAEFGQAYQAWDERGLMKAAATFARAPESFTPVYWRGTAEFHRLLCLLGRPTAAANPEAAEKALAATISTLERAVALNPGSAEARALLGTAYGLSIASNPVRAVWLGPRVMEQQKQARRLGPENPRVFYLDGMSRFYGPSMLGGKEEALKLLLEAEKLFEKESGRPAGPFEPRWGRSTCLVYLGRTYEALGRQGEAERYYRKALAVNPRDRLAQSELEKPRK